LFAVKYLSTRKSFFFIFIGLPAFALYLYFFAGFKQILSVLQGVNLEQYALFYALAISAVFVGNFFWSVSWRTVLSTLSVKMSMKNAFVYYWAGYFVDLVVPCQMVCGEVTRLYLVHKETNENYGSIAAGGVTNRIVAYIIVVAGLYTSAVLLYSQSSVPTIISSVFIFVLTGATIYLAILLYLAFSEQAAGKLALLALKLLRVLRPKKYNSTDLSAETKEALAGFYNGFKAFRETPKRLVKPFIYLTLSFLLSLFAYVLVFIALGIRGESLGFFIVMYFIAGSLTDAAASFSVGTLDILLATLFILYGLNPALSGITAALVRVVTFWFPLIVGYVIVQIVGAKNLLAPHPKDTIAVQQASG
jgi:uncharacterized protein (TIRG00374 family)